MLRNEMGCLIELKTNQMCYLYSHHSFGRLAYSVNTAISDNNISKFHFIVEWESAQWHIKDISRNGTWLNGQKLTLNRKYSLTLGDKIAFDENSPARYQVKDLSSPGDLLIAEQSSKHHDQKVIKLSNYHILPTNDAPEITVFYNTEKDHWCLESLCETNSQIRMLEDNERVYFDNQNWYLRLDKGDEPTVEYQNVKIQVRDYQYTFKVSQDEEVTELSFLLDDNPVDLQHRTHHYLTLNLARLRAADAADGFDQSSQGWIYSEDLSKKLGIDILHMNSQVHRARKQFSNAYKTNINSNNFIQRRPGQLRFAGVNFKIYKGDTLECEMSDLME